MGERFRYFVLEADEDMFCQKHRKSQTAVPEKRGFAALSRNFLSMRLLKASVERSAGSSSAELLSKSSAIQLWINDGVGRRLCAFFPSYCS